MAIGVNGINSDVIKPVIGEYSDDTGTLCKSVRLNMWSKVKPFRHSNPALSMAETEAALANQNYGLSASGGTNPVTVARNTWAYLKPRGLQYSEPFRLGDFRKYAHDASRPVGNFAPTSVTASYASANFVMTFPAETTGLALTELPLLSDKYLAVVLSNDNFVDDLWIVSSNTTIGDGGTTVTLNKAFPFSVKGSWRTKILAVDIAVGSTPRELSSVAGRTFYPLPFETPATQNDSTFQIVAVANEIIMSVVTKWNISGRLGEAYVLAEYNDGCAMLRDVTCYYASIIVTDGGGTRHIIQIPETPIVIPAGESAAQGLRIEGLLGWPARTDGATVQVDTTAHAEDSWSGLYERKVNTY